MGDRLRDSINGKIPFDLVIKNVKYVNLLTKECYISQIGITDGKIGHVNQPGEEDLEGTIIYDGMGKYAIPGLIDTHVHIESGMMTASNMAKAILPHGTTTIACDPHEICNVLGINGIKYISESSKNIPLIVKLLVPSCVPSVLGLETSGAVFDAAKIEEMFKIDGVAGLAEVMDFPGVINGSERMDSILEAARKNTQFIQGHAPSVTGRKLSAYLSTGVSSCHETSFAAEAKYKLRAGMTLECRESSTVHDICELSPVIKEFDYPPTTTFCTDDREPDDLFREGHIDHVIRVAISAGIPPIEAVKIATYNAANLLNCNDIGLLVPGRYANIVLLDDLYEFVSDEVFVKGVLIAKNGKMTYEISEFGHAVENLNTVKLKNKISIDDFKIKCSKEEACVNIMAFDPNIPIITNLTKEKLPVSNGYIDISEREDLCILSVFERHGKNGNKSTCLVKNLGLKEGAIASTVSHDSHNLIVVGKNEQDMLLASNLLSESGGGIVCVLNGEIISFVKLPIAGLMSKETIEEIAPKTAHVKASIKRLGIDSKCPILQVGSFALTVVPNVRLTDCGLVDVGKQTIIPILE